MEGQAPGSEHEALVTVHAPSRSTVLAAHREAQRFVSSMTLGLVLFKNTSPVTCKVPSPLDSTSTGPPGTQRL